MSTPSSDSLSVMSSMVLGNRKGFLPSNNLFSENILGAAASLSLGVGIIRLLLSSYRKPVNSDIDSDHGDAIAVRGGVTNAVLRSIRHALRRLLLDADELDQYESKRPVDEVNVTDGSFITHQGSCHCNSVQFEIRAPRTLIAKEGPGKISYRHTEIKSSNFRVVRGANHLKTYYVKVKDDRGAHAFCDRCGSHILYAPSRNSQRLLINIDILDEGIRKIKVVDTKCSLASGISLESQWDDQLTTISEISHDVHFSIKPTPFRMDSSLSMDYESISTDFKVYDELDRLDPFNQKSYPNSPRTLTTVESFTAHAIDTHSLPALRIPRGHYADSASVMTDDAYSITPSEFARGATSPTKSLAQMKKYMKKHASPPPTQVPERAESSNETTNKHQMAANAGKVVASLLNFG
jgi:hypothetical protein